MGRIAKGLLGATAVGLAGLGALAAWPAAGPPPEIAEEGDVDRGVYLARAAGCIACHSDVEGGGAPLAGGVEFETPFGTIWSPNLTTDPVHGMGGWTIGEFARAVRQGVSPEGEPYYPAFTYPFYARFTDQQIADLWAAFQTVPAAATPSAGPDMAFPFDQRWGLKLWRAAYLYPPRTAPVEGRSDVWNRGRELVEGASHCAACHTPRGLFGQRLIEEARYAGNAALPGGDEAPPITPSALAGAGWDIDSLAYSLRTGITPSGDAFGGSMGEVVMQGTQYLTPEDLAAMATYLMERDG